MQNSQSRRAFLLTGIAPAIFAACNAAERLLPARNQDTYHHGAVPIEMKDVVFPEEWSGFAYKAFSQYEKPGKLEQLIGEMNYYPLQFLEGCLDKVFYIKVLSKNGDASWGGTRSFNETTRRGKIWTCYPIVFHGELSSILFFKHLNIFPKDEWRNFNPAGFEYVGFDPSQMANYRGSDEFRFERELADGFVSLYSKTSLEQDFNDVYQNLFQDSAKLFYYGTIYPKLGGKIDLAIKFLGDVLGARVSRGDFLARKKPLA